MAAADNLRVYITTLCTCTSDGKPVCGTERDVCVLYNQTQISYEEVKQLFDNDTWEYDPRLTRLTMRQCEMLQDKKEN
jgi:hypothetical protein